MANPVEFKGYNVRLYPPIDLHEVIGPLPVYRGGRMSVSCWQLTSEELADVINSGGKLYVALAVGKGNSQPAMYVGSEDTVRQQVADNGPVWDRK